ncbi:ParA family protein [Vibrio vulnificus]|uniref:ParA family protein n=1 Tax=Vibrio vulnificus TaxID=672 RepID=UPI0024E01C6F|nr:ParA family protein [Vibrio vulnificus]EIE1227678.1 ParA family protein [Vibrio vulnificus]MDK2679259.1 ParA family protein [Vibrio vulnificus]MDK2688012.1 ParA family protein [Vibrio vulnificus]
MIITIGHNKGGVGKSTIALNLAAVLKPDIIIDQDAHQSIAILNRLRATPLNVIAGHTTRAELIEQIKQADDGKIILIDCGGFDSALNRLAVAAADIVIVPASDDTTELIGLRNFDTVLAEISKEMDTHIEAYVLCNKVHPNRKKFDEIDEFLQKAVHMKRLNSVIPRRGQFTEAIKHGLGVVEHKATKYSTASREIKALADEIKEIINTL